MIERLVAANQHLVGAREHHKAIEDAIEFLRKHQEAVEWAHDLMQHARPLVLNMMKIEEARSAMK